MFIELFGVFVEFFVNIELLKGELIWLVLFMCVVGIEVLFWNVLDIVILK